MNKEILKAVSEMLKIGSMGLEEFKVQVKCAKIVLDKIIEGMEGIKPIPPTGNFPLETIRPMRNYPNVTETKHSSNFRIIVNDVGKIERIDGLPLDGLVELDGKKMTHTQSIGKTFTHGKIL